MTSNVNNRGIAHLSFRLGGVPFCKSRRAHAVVTAGNTMGYVICKRCKAHAKKMAERAAKKNIDELIEADKRAGGARLSPDSSRVGSKQ